MDWPALRVSLQLGVWTVLLLLPAGIWAGHQLATRQFRGKAIVEALVAIPLILPPTVLGFYLLVSFSARSPLGGAFERVMGDTLAF
jgi:molybdate transport system permease protein